MNKKSIITLAVVIIFLLTVVIFWQMTKEEDEIELQVISYDQCVATGGLKLDTNPPSCRTKEGEVFIKELTNADQKQDQIVLDNPAEGEIVESPINISGQARGGWFFEATFPVRLEDENGNIIAQSYVQTDKEWMTQDFVPFFGDLEYEIDRAIDGFLILEKANPSGLPEHADELMVSVIINN